MTDVRAAASRHRGRVAFWALAGLALLVAHDAIHLVQVGPGQALVEALRTAGHGYWGWASLALTAAAILAGVAAWLRLRRLRQQASTLRAATAATPPFARRFARTWLGLAAVVAIGFIVQENVEHFVAHGHALGTGAVLGPEQPLALPIIGLICAFAAAVATLVVGAHEALVIAIRSALRRQIRAPRTVARPPARLLTATVSILARRGAGRAPPALVVSAR